MTADTISARGTWGAFTAVVRELPRQKRQPQRYTGTVRATDQTWELAVESTRHGWRVTSYRSALLSIEIPKDASVVVIPSEGAIAALNAGVTTLRRSLDK